MSAYDRDAWEARWAPPSGLVDVIAARQQALHDTIRTFAARGVPAFVAMWGTSHSRQPLRDRRHLLAHRAVYEAALS